ncbi:MAG: Holliday junction resolvase RuvX [Spirochaetes bacterium]|nr:Holliday junction resolvase RuvX [Spirochaetota bacterium]
MSDRLLCIDYGKKFTGFAVADFPGFTARALNTQPTDRGDIFATVRALVQNESITRFIVGFPFSDVEGAIHHAIRQFTAELAQRFPEIPYEFFDEAYSSQEADALMQETGIGKRKKNRAQDSEAAKIVLLRYLRANEK